MRVDIVLDDLGREHDDPDQLEIDLEMRPWEFRSRLRLQAGQLLIVRVKAHRKHRTDVHAELPRRGRVHDHLVGAPRIGEPTTLERHAIHLREHAVETPTDARRGTTRRHMNLVAVERRDLGIDDREVRDLLHEGQPRDLCDQPRVVGDVAHARRVERGNDPQRVSIDMPQVCGERRLRTPRPRDGADRQPADQPDQHDDRE